MDKPSTAHKISRLIETVTALRQRCLAYEKRHAAAVAAAAPGYRESARNLLHYLALRQHDIRGLQEELSALGLTSLGRLEAHTMATLNAVLRTLHRLARQPAPAIAKTDAPVDFVSGPKLLREHAERLLGAEPANRPVRIMVTMPTEAAHDPALVEALVAAGMNVMRINCAHDGAAAWSGMAANLRTAEQAVGRSCRIIADLAGPKLRTGAVAACDGVVKFRPRRDVDGTVLAPAKLWLTPADAPTMPPDGTAGRLLVEGDLLARVRPGDIIDVEEHRGRKRSLTVTAVENGSCWAVSDRTLYVAEGASLRKKGGKGGKKARGRVVSVPPVIEPLVLRRGDTLVLTRGAEPGRPSRSEVTDAAMSGRAECVMLNKGPFIVDAVTFLDGILDTMDDHQSKKSAMLRRLQVSHMAGAEPS